MFDVIVIGGSYAGLSAALQVARARRKVAVVDAGVRRNRFAASSHGFLGHDGDDPADIAAQARAQLLAYPSVTWVEGTAHEAHVEADVFTVRLASGARLEARRLVLAVGVVDELPDIPGVAERWGRSVFHCPYCHGYEIARAPVGVLATSSASVHAALLLPDWGPTTYFTRGLFLPNDDERVALERRGVTLENAAVTAIEDTATVCLETGRKLTFGGLFLAPRSCVASPLAAQLGCAFDEGPLGAYVRTDAMKETTVRGVFACGDAAVPAGSVAFAVGDGARAGISAHQSLVFRERPSA